MEFKKKLKRKLARLLGAYTPEELGWENLFPEVTYISTSGCLYGDRWDWKVNIAHAHASVICLGKRKYLYAKDGVSPGDFMWHEYAHILAKDGADPHNLEWSWKLVELKKEYIMFPYIPYSRWYNDENTGTIRLRT